MTGYYLTIWDQNIFVEHLICAWARLYIGKDVRHDRELFNFNVKVSALNKLFFAFESRHEKMSSGVSDQVSHKLTCSATATS